MKFAAPPMAKVQTVFQKPVMWETLGDPRSFAALVIVCFLGLLKWILPHYIGSRDWWDNAFVILPAFLFLPWPKGFRAYYKLVCVVYIPVYFCWVMVYLLYFSPLKALGTLAAAGLVTALARAGKTRPQSIFALGLSLAVVASPLMMVDLDDLIGRRVLAAVGLSGIMVLLFLHRDWARLRPAGFFLCVTMAVALPVFTMEKFMPRQALGEALASAEGVEQLFSPKVERLPRVPLQLLDNGAGEEERFFITPHKSSRRLAVLRRNGSVRTIDLGGRMPNHSEKRGDIIHTVIGNVLASIDTGTMKVTRQMRLSPEMAQGDWHANVGLFFLNDAGSRAYVSWDGGWSCVVVDMKNFSVIARLRQKMGGTCRPFAKDRRVLVTSIEWPGCRLMVYDARSNKLLVERKLAGLGFNVALHEPHSDRIFFFRITTGLVMALDPNTLETLGQVHLRPGVWGGVADPTRPILYAWDYFTGTVYALNANTLEVMNRVRLGPNLHVVSLSTDKKSLLAVTTAGGFRVDLSRWPL